MFAHSLFVSHNTFTPSLSLFLSPPSLHLSPSLSLSLSLSVGLGNPSVVERELLSSNATFICFHPPIQKQREEWKKSFSVRRLHLLLITLSSVEYAASSPSFSFTRVFSLSAVCVCVCMCVCVCVCVCVCLCTKEKENIKSLR